VIGCGPVGLSVVMALKAAGFGPVVATDFSPHRRQLAECLGADIVVDPAERAPFDCWLEAAEAPQGFDMYGPTAMLSIGAQPRPCVAFECVGVPGLIARTMLDLPPRSRLVVVGVCMQTDQIEPIVGIGKELDLSFSFGYRPQGVRCHPHRPRRRPPRCRPLDHRPRHPRRGPCGLRDASPSR